MIACVHPEGDYKYLPARQKHATVFEQALLSDSSGTERGVDKPRIDGILVV